MPLGSIWAPTRGRHWKNIKKKFFSETTRPRAFIFCMLQCVVVLFINPANHAPGVKNGPAPGIISSHRHTMGKQKHKKICFSETFHILCVTKYSGPLYKSCQPCPWGPYGPRPGASWKKHKTNFFSETIRPRAFIFCVQQCIVVLYMNPANRISGVNTGPAPGAS